MVTAYGKVRGEPRLACEECRDGRAAAGSVFCVECLRAASRYGAAFLRAAERALGQRPALLAQAA